MLNLGAAFDTINHNIDRNTIVNCLENTFLIRDLALPFFSSNLKLEHK